MSIPETLPPLPPNTNPELARWIEIYVGKLQQDVSRLKQFLQPAINNNNSTPNQIFDSGD